MPGGTEKIAGLWFARWESVPRMTLWGNWKLDRENMGLPRVWNLSSALKSFFLNEKIKLLKL